MGYPEYPAGLFALPTLDGTPVETLVRVGVRPDRAGEALCNALGWILSREMVVSSLTLAAAPEPPPARGDLSAAPPWSSIQALLCIQKD